MSRHTLVSLEEANCFNYIVVVRESSHTHTFKYTLSFMSHLCCSLFSVRNEKTAFAWIKGTLVKYSEMDNNNNIHNP